MTTKEEKKWEAESDARTIAEAEAIKGDPERIKAAQKAAKEMSEEKQREADALRSLSKGNMHYPTMNKE